MSSQPSLVYRTLWHLRFRRNLKDGGILWDLRFRSNVKNWKIEFQNLMKLLYEQNITVLDHDHANGMRREAKFFQGSPSTTD